MPPRITNQIVDVPLNGNMVKGILNGDETNWSFNSLSRDFLALFPEGVVYSYTYLGVDRLHYEHHRFQLAIASRVKELISEKLEAVRQRVATPKPVAMPRRFVAPIR